MVRILFLWVFCVLAAAPLKAQMYSTQYRVPGQSWMEVNTERFRLIYPERYENEAYHTLTVLEREYANIQDLVGGGVQHFPFILNPENDRSNGFVSPLNFRSEVEISPIISKSMNPKSGDWLDFVVPHELVHVLHFSENPKSFTRLFGLFSPDMRRSVHSAAPLGFLEGVAVQYESHNLMPEAGRGHYSYFRNQFRSMLASSNEWSMGQLVQTTDFTPPFNRHYIGGYEFINWLLSSYGENSMKEAIQFHYHYPFLGFGVALRHVTGQWPGNLYDQFSEEKRESEYLRREEIGETTDDESKQVPFPATCKRLNRPDWLDEDTLIFFGRSCNRTSGFYMYQLNSGSFDLLKEVSISDEHSYDLSREKNTIAYSRYHRHMLYDNISRGDLHQLNIETGHSERITKSKRLFAPAWTGNDLLALQTQASEMGLVRINPESGEILRRYSQPEHSSIVQAAPNPHDPDITAVIGRVRTVQGIWFENLENKSSILDSEPDIVFQQGSVFDVSWHPTEEKLLFVSDYTGTMNVYEYEVRSKIIHQLTNSRFNAFEASYSPKGNQIAYILQNEDEQTLHILDADDAVRSEIAGEHWQFNRETEAKINRPLVDREDEIDKSEWQPESFSTGFSWLKPRLWLPTYEEINGYHRPGITLESVDVMNSQAYSTDLSILAGKFWYNGSYTYKGFYPGFRAELYNDPIFTTFRIGDEENERTVDLLQQSRGASFRVPIPLVLESNVRFTSLFVEPQYFVSQIRFLDPDQDSAPISDFGTRHTVGLRTVLNWNIRQFIRDVQPNNGWSFFVEMRHALNRDQFTIETSDFSIDGNLVKRRGLRAGAITWLSPLRRWNQSLRLSARVYTQTDVPVFGVLSQYSDHFSENPLAGANNVGLLNTRYTIPVIYPDEGGLLLPVYLSNIYLVLFSQTATDLDRSDYLSGSRSIFGAGIRSRFRISNLAVDIGISIGWEPSRNNVSYQFGFF